MTPNEISWHPRTLGVFMEHAAAAKHTIVLSAALPPPIVPDQWHVVDVADVLKKCSSAEVSETPTKTPRSRTKTSRRDAPATPVSTSTSTPVGPESDANTSPSAEATAVEKEVASAEEKARLAGLHWTSAKIAKMTRPLVEQILRESLQGTGYQVWHGRLQPIV